MSDPWPRFEQGTTKRFTITYSAAPATTPLFAVYAGSGDTILAYSATAQSSSSTAFYDHFTVASEAFYSYLWTASFTAGPAVHRGWFQGVKRQSP